MLPPMNAINSPACLAPAKPPSNVATTGELRAIDPPLSLSRRQKASSQTRVALITEPIGMRWMTWARSAGSGSLNDLRCEPAGS